MVEIKPLSVASFANIFFHSICCHHFVYGFLCFTKTGKFDRTHLFIFLKFLLPGGTDLRKHWYDLSENRKPLYFHLLVIH